MRVYITGIAGFLGSHIAEHFSNQGHEVYGIDSLIGGDPKNVPDGVSWMIGDILDEDLLFSRIQSFRPDLVYHCAALAYEGLSVFSPSLVSRNIYSGSANVMTACIKAQVPMYVQCSSMARYGELRAPFSEEMTPDPVDPYGISKLAADRLLEMLGSTHGLRYAIAVPHNLIGSRQKYDDPFRNVCSIMINLMLQGRNPVIYGDGKQTRCFTFIQDALNCLTAFPEKEDSWYQVINIGPDEGAVTILELAQTIADLIGFDLKPVFVPGRPCEVKHAMCSSDKARRLLGYKTRYTLREGLSEMIEWIRKKGTKPFQYHLPIQINSELCPKTWKQRLF